MKKAPDLWGRGPIDTGGETGIEPWIERYRLEFCLSLPADFDLAALEGIAA